MNSSNKINVSYSSLMGLKAELLRKQAEVDAAKVKNEGNNIQPGPTKSKSKKSKEKLEKVNTKLTKPEVKDVDDIKIHTKSKLMLEAKSRLYDNLKKSHTNSNPNFLVDFANKSDSEEDQKEVIVTNLKVEENESGSDFDDDDDWVEYVDCFGRTRKCLKEDLPAMKEKDRILSQNVSRNSGSKEDVGAEDIAPRPTSPSREPELELMRKKWEAQMEKLVNKTDIHYQDILFDEARTHGVGYYAFSQDEEERKKQQENLKQIRKETEEKQKQTQETREKKLLMERNRLKAAKIRQKIRTGLPGELTEEEIAEIDVKYNLIENQNTKEDEKLQGTKEENEENCVKKEEKQNSLSDIEDKINSFGELLGKRNKWYTMSQEEWVDKRRKIRDQEFAPVYFVKPNKSVLNAKEEKSEDEKEEKEEVEEEDIIGPLPPNEFSGKENTQGGKDKESEKEENTKSKVDDDQILAGLKYLRSKFEEEKKS